MHESLGTHGYEFAKIATMLQNKERKFAQMLLHQMELIYIGFPHCDYIAIIFTSSFVNL